MPRIMGLSAARAKVPNMFLRFVLMMGGRMHTPRRPQSERNNPALPNRFLQQHPNHPHPFLYTHRIKPDNTKTPKPRAGGSVYQFAAYEVRSFGCRVLKLGLGGGSEFRDLGHHLGGTCGNSGHGHERRVSRWQQQRLRPSQCQLS